MGSFASRADLQAIEAESGWADRDVAGSMYDFLGRTRMAHGTRPAISYQLLSEPGSKAITLTWHDLHARVTQAANLFRSLGVGAKDVVAYDHAQRAGNRRHPAGRRRGGHRQPDQPAA